MKRNLTSIKKVMFLMIAAGLINNSQAQMDEIVISIENRENTRITEVVTGVEVVSIVTDPVTHEESAVTDRTVVTQTEDSITISESHTETPIVIPPTTIDELVALINTGKIKTYKELIANLANFPELAALAEQFLKENITDTVTALKRFGLIQDKAVKMKLISLVTKIRDKDKLWNLFRK